MMLKRTRFVSREKPTFSSIDRIMGINRSVSKLLVTLLTTHEIRSNPIPVSIFFRGSGVFVPSFSRLNSIKTKFHTSKNRPHSHSGLHSSEPHPTDSPKSTKISESNPEGPTSAICQKLSEESIILVFGRN